MSTLEKTAPVEDSVAKVNEEFAVGSDLKFQRQWQRVERIIWGVLCAFLLLSGAGVFGRGPLANATVVAADKSLTIKYERVERFSTPSVLTLDFNPSLIHNGQVQLWVSDALVKPLGNQRVVPQPVKSEIGNGGILYSFLASAGMASVEFQTQPAVLGSTKLDLYVPGSSRVQLNIFVVP